MSNILMVFINGNGHAAPMIALSAELARRGHAITMVSTGETSLLKNAVIHHATDETYMDGYFSLANQTAWFKKWSESTNDLKMAGETFNMLALVYEPTWNTINDLISTKEDSYDLIISDYVTTAGLDAAVQNGIPLVINWPGLIMPFQSASFVTSPLTRYALPLTNPVYRFLNHFLIQMMAHVLPYTSKLQAVRSKLLSTTTTLTVPETWQMHPILFNTALGVSEIAQYHSPLEHFVGALLPTTNNTHDQKKQHLDQNVATWLEDEVPKDRPVVLVNFGTTGFVQRWKWEAVVEAVGNMPESSRPYILWRIGKEQSDELGIMDQQREELLLPKYMKIIHWIKPTQQAALCHHRVTLFVTHGGINSPQEAMLCGKPLVVIPSFGDQAAHGARLEAAGIAVNMGRGIFGPKKFQEALENILGNLTHYQKRLERARRIQQLAGGTIRAADIVESTLLHGYQHLIPADMHLPFVQRVLALDIAAGYAVLIFLVLFGPLFIARKCLRHWIKVKTAERTILHVKTE